MARFHEGASPSAASGEDLDRMRFALCTELPGEYARFLTTFGEAYTPSILSVVLDAPGEEQFDLQNLTGVDEAIEATKAAWDAGMPDDLIAFGNDCMSNLYCFRRRPVGEVAPERAEVVVFDHDEDEVEWVADSLTDLLASFLRLPPGTKESG